MLDNECDIFIGTNSHGFSQAYEENDFVYHEICIECLRLYTNTGGGLACPECQESFLRECKMDYYDEYEWTID